MARRHAIVSLREPQRYVAMRHFAAQYSIIAVRPHLIGLPAENADWRCGSQVERDDSAAQKKAGLSQLSLRSRDAYFADNT
jgi:hypothetical protein